MPKPFCLPPLPCGLSWRKCLLNLVGSAILAFGLYHIHSFAGVTEGGILGATLLLQYWFGVSPAWSSLVMNALSYLIGWRIHLLRLPAELLNKEGRDVHLCV